MFPLLPDLPIAGRVPDFRFGFLPNDKLRTSLFLPGPLELAQGDPKWLTFTFDPPAATGLTALGTASQSVNVDKRMLVYAITGCMKAAGGNGADVAAGLLVTLSQTHGGKKIQWSLKPVHSAACLGTGQLPFTLNHTQLVEAGDSLACSVKSLATAAGPAPNSNYVQIVLFGVSLP